MINDGKYTAINRMRTKLLSIFLLLSPPIQAIADKNPPPDFTTNYQYPVTLNPGPRAEFFTRVDMALLVLLMLLTAWFLLNKRSRKEIRLISLFSLLYFGFYRHGCICTVGSIQNVAMAIFNHGYALPLAAGAFFLIPLLFALYFGRVFCAAVCPLGAAQELVLQKAHRVPETLDSALSLAPYLYLGAGVLFAATGSAFVICQYDPFIAFFRMSGGAGMITFGAAILLISTVVGRPYCRYLCPYSVLLRWAAPFARWKVHVSPADCVQCHLCADACPYGAITMPTPEDVTISRKKERRNLTKLILLLPVLVLAGAVFGRLSSPILSRMDHSVRTAERLWKERHDVVQGTTLDTDAVRAHQESDAEVYKDAYLVKKEYDKGSLLFGMWIGLIIGMKLIFLAIPQKRKDYDADPAACLGCARCFASCPVERFPVDIPLTLQK
jgi:polyferredoxin